MNESNIVTSIDKAQSSLPDVGLLILAILMLIVLVFSLLVLKQSSHMVKVLPTPLSPYVRTAAISYVVFSFITLLLIIFYTLN